QSHYDGFLRKGRVGGVATPVPQRREPSGDMSSSLGSAVTACIILFVLGIAAWIYQHTNALGL
ncbi:MAG TPA: hypothetical protein DCY41_02095, partial [Opitutae bacterium]|nr:hypothetical protein [Opitutae bacterium]